MEKQQKLVPAAAVKGVASGLYMMAVFTLVWTGIAYQGLRGSAYALVLVVFVVFAVTFIVKGSAIYKLAKLFPGIESEEEKAEEKRMSKWFAIIFGAEGLLIFIAANVVINLKHSELVIPAIALVVGLHFFPLARVFKRTVDYYLATWSTIIAVAAIVMSLEKTLSEPGIFAFTGIGLAVATSCYGFFMMNNGSKLSKTLAA